MIELQDEKWLSTSEVTSALKISRSTLFALRQANAAPRNVKVGRTLYYNEEAIVNWLHEHEESA